MNCKLENWAKDLSFSLTSRRNNDNREIMVCCHLGENTVTSFFGFQEHFTYREKYYGTISFYLIPKS